MFYPVPFGHRAVGNNIVTGAVISPVSQASLRGTQTKFAPRFFDSRESK